MATSMTGSPPRKQDAGSTDRARTVGVAIQQAFPGKPQRFLPQANLYAVPYRRAVDASLVDEIVGFIANCQSDLEKIGIKGMVVGLSGGVDSVVCLELCRRAAPASSVKAVTVLAGDGAEIRRLNGLAECAGKLAVEHVIVDARAAEAAMAAAWPETGPWSSINILTRLVHSLIFQAADAMQAAVCSTTDRSEELLGRYTEHFYGHVAPLAHLYKTEVIDLAHFLGAATAVQSKRPGCESHWYDDEVLGAEYGVIDPLLHLMVEEHLTDEEIGLRCAIDDIQWLSRLRKRIDCQPARVTTRKLQRST